MKEAERGVSKRGWKRFLATMGKELLRWLMARPSERDLAELEAYEKDVRQSIRTYTEEAWDVRAHRLAELIAHHDQLCDPDRDLVVDRMRTASANVSEIDVRTFLVIAFFQSGFVAGIAVWLGTPALGASWARGWDNFLRVTLSFGLLLVALAVLLYFARRIARSQLGRPILDELLSVANSSPSSDELEDNTAGANANNSQNAPGSAAHEQEVSSDSEEGSSTERGAEGESAKVKETARIKQVARIKRIARIQCEPINIPLHPELRNVPFSWILRKHAIATRVVPIVIVWVIAAAVLFVKSHREPEPSLAVQLGATVLLAPAMLILVAGVYVDLTLLIRRIYVSWFRRDTAVDELLLLLLDVSDAANRYTQSWQDRRVRRELSKHVDRAARLAEKSIPRVLRRIAPNSETRTWVVKKGRDVAAGFRRMEQDLVLAGPQVLADTSTKTFGTMCALARSDWSALTKYEAPPRGPTLVRKFFQRVGPAMVFGLAALILPAALSLKGEGANNLRVYLGVAAALALVATNAPEAVKTIQESIEKVKPFSK